jgi:hypothetical protein
MTIYVCKHPKPVIYWTNFLVCDILWYMGKIEFISTIDGLDQIEECRPKPAKSFIPKWFKDIPNNGKSTVKICPSFPDFFSQGYIVPMWCDSILSVDVETDKWGWSTSNDKFTWSSHSMDQFIDYVNPSFNGVDSQFVFKTNCPWRVITPKGWSVLQLPLFYHFNREYSILPGIIDTDIHHEINQQVLYHGDGREIHIKRGDPFVLYVPFKRKNTLKIDIKYQSEDHKKIFTVQDLDLSTSFSPNGFYRKRQRLRDKNE